MWISAITLQQLLIQFVDVNAKAILYFVKYLVRNTVQLRKHSLLSDEYVVYYAAANMSAVRCPFVTGSGVTVFAHLHNSRSCLILEDTSPSLSLCKTSCGET